jgi:hypothetical protein
MYHNGYNYWQHLNHLVRTVCYVSLPQTRESIQVDIVVKWISRKYNTVSLRDPVIRTVQLAYAEAEHSLSLRSSISLVHARL